MQWKHAENKALSGSGKPREVHLQALWPEVNRPNAMFLRKTGSTEEPKQHRSGAGGAAGRACSDPCGTNAFGLTAIAKHGFTENHS